MVSFYVDITPVLKLLLPPDFTIMGLYKTGYFYFLWAFHAFIGFHLTLFNPSNKNPSYPFNLTYFFLIILAAFL